MTPESQIPMRNPEPDPLAALSAMGNSGEGMADAGGAPTADDMAEGILGSLRTIMALAVSGAKSAPPIADKMKQVRQSAMEAMLVVQNMTAQNGNEGGTAY